MTARAGARQLALLTERPTERELIQRLYDELERYATSGGHRAMANYRESRGECSWKRCGDSCTRFRGLMNEVADYLTADASATSTPAARRVS